MTLYREELRRWYLNQECELLRYRINAQSPDAIEGFLARCGLQYPPIGAEELAEHREALDRMALIAAQERKRAAAAAAASAPGNGGPSMAGVQSRHLAAPGDGAASASVFFKVPFEKALELVQRRRVYLNGGWAFVSQTDLVSIIVGEFRAHLSHALTLCAKAMPQLQEDERILPLLTNVAQHYAGPDYAKAKIAGEVTPDQLDGLAARSMPLCMATLHRQLRANHHLKHGGRLQYGLFLKGIGLKLEDALAFWKSELTQAMASDKFDKQYAYNIRHNYGKEGKRVDYAPHPCLKIIMGAPPGVGDHHGCPFRHSSPDSLAVTLASKGVPSPGIGEVLELVRGSHYQVACMRYFHLTHAGADTDLVVNHPNEYFAASEAYYRARAPAPAFAAATSAAGSAAASMALSLEPVEEPDPSAAPDAPDAQDAQDAPAAMVL